MYMISGSASVFEVEVEEVRGAEVVVVVVVVDLVVDVPLGQL